MTRFAPPKLAPTSWKLCDSSANTPALCKYAGEALGGVKRLQAMICRQALPVAQIRLSKGWVGTKLDTATIARFWRKAQFPPYPDEP